MPHPSSKKLLLGRQIDRIINIECDLQDFASFRKAGAEIKAANKEIYCVSCNAGIALTVDKATKDGCCNQMQNNYLSHFLLVAELYPLLEVEATAPGGARVVFHSSEPRNMTKNKKNS